jgi:hypothetical protein
MSKLSKPPLAYNEQFQQRHASELERELSRCHKKNENIELGATAIIMTSPNGTRYKLTVDNSGVLGTTAL